MEYLLRIAGDAPDLDRIGRELSALDPSLVLDFDPRGRALRLSTSATADELLGGLRAAGVAARAGDLERQPSVCCGGCSFG